MTGRYFYSSSNRCALSFFFFFFFCLRRSDVLESKQLERDYHVQKTFYETRLERDCQELHYPPPHPTIRIPIPTLPLLFRCRRDAR